MKIIVNRKEIANIMTHRSMTLEEAMYIAGWDIGSQEDCEKAYHDDVEGFYLDDCGYYAFDTDAAEMVY